jgi:hypothetical protein
MAVSSLFSKTYMEIRALGNINIEYIQFLLHE